MRHVARIHLLTMLALAIGLAVLSAAGSASLGGAIPGPLPLFPPGNWWNIDVSTAPLDPGSASYIGFINNVSGAYDTRWDNGILNPAFHSITANDLEVLQLGYRPPAAPLTAPTNLRIIR